MIELKYYRDDALQALIKNTELNLLRYKESSSSWAEEFFASQEIRMPSVSMNISIPDIEFVPRDNSSRHDGDNAVLIHKALSGKISRIQACDMRFWAYLSHEPLYSNYMQKRWPISTAGTASEHYLNGKTIVRNGIARLFWMAEFTYNENPSLGEDPYEFTYYLGGNEDLYNQMAGSAVVRNKGTLRSVLKIMRDSGMNENQKRLFFNKLNEAGGVMILDALEGKKADEFCERLAEDTINTKFIESNDIVRLRYMNGGQEIETLAKGGKLYKNGRLLKVKPGNVNRLRVGGTVTMGKSELTVVEIRNA